MNGAQFSSAAKRIFPMVGILALAFFQSLEIRLLEFSNDWKFAGRRDRRVHETIFVRQRSPAGRTESESPASWMRRAFFQ
jgi:hypothetical protein